MVKTKSLLWRAGLSAVAALMLTTTAEARRPAKAAAAADVVVQTSHELNPAVIQMVDPLEGIAVGEPDPTAGGGTEPPAGDGSGDGTDPTVVGGSVDWTDPGAGDGTDPGVGDGTDPGVGDGTDPGVGDVPDPGVGDGSGATDGGVVDSGTVTIYYMDGGPARCDTCAQNNMASPGVVPNLSQVERHVRRAKTATDVVAQSSDTPSGIAPSAVSRPVILPGSHSDVARQPMFHASAACLGEHPGLAWMCEWQSAGQ